MATFHSVKLELLRAGLAHNQLLSRLTPYLALCGEGAPITFNVDVDHWNLLNSLERLRYLTIPNAVREAAVGELGEDVANVLAKIPTLLAEVSRAHGEATRQADSDYVHLSLVLGGAELSLIPFEIAFSPQSFPGEGLEFCLQLDLPVVPTRDTRRSRRVPAPWHSGDPRILVIAADPMNYGIPLTDHLHQIRIAIEPWVGWPRHGGTVSEDERLPFVKQRLRVLPAASLEQIRDVCAREKFTHVHILAHGGEYTVARETMFGIVLHSDDASKQVDVVNGKRLAKALQAEASDGVGRSSPLVVTLAACDSGKPGSVLLPGGSVAHDLHTEGIPWVFASQFPLTKAGSTRMIEALYPGLLRGDDPRLVLYETRRMLYMTSDRDHDWASLVVYASVPRDFDDQIAIFFERRSRAAVDNAMGRTDDLADASPDDAAANAEMEMLLDRLKRIMGTWMARLPADELESAWMDRPRWQQDLERQRRSQDRAEAYGMHGSVYKRIALIRYRRGQLEAGRLSLGTASEYYGRAAEESAKFTVGAKFHWVATQWLSLAAVLKEPADPNTFDRAYYMARSLLQHPSPLEQAWAYGTLAELEMISVHHDPEKWPRADLQGMVVAHCREIVRLTGPDSFPVTSTQRQFQRYVLYWRDPRWDAIAEAAVAALGGNG